MRRVIVAVGLLLVLGCSARPTPAVGPMREVAVVTEWWGTVEPVLRTILEREIRTPQPEPEFRLRVFTPEQFQSYSLLRTVFVVGTVGDTVVRATLGNRVDSLPAGDFGLFRVPNPWAMHQQLVVFAARNESLLAPGLEEYGPRIRYTFWNVALENSARALYLLGRNTGPEESLKRRYSFSVDVPKKWYLREEHAESRFVYLFGHDPDRGVFIHWSDTTRLLAPDSMLALRDRLTGEFYDGDAAERSYAEFDTIEFLSGPALRLLGLWQNDARTVGGPFVSYCFNYQGRFFMVDGLVFNPGKKKLDQLLRVEAMVATFTPQ